MKPYVRRHFTQDWPWTWTGLSWSSGGLITAAIHQRNQSVHHCEGQTVRGIPKGRQGTKTKFTLPAVIPSSQPHVPACDRRGMIRGCPLWPTLSAEPCHSLLLFQLELQRHLKEPLRGNVWCGSKRHIQVTSHTCGHFNLYQMYLNYFFFPPDEKKWS